MNEISDKTVLVHGTGINISWAERIAREAGRTLWFTNWKQSFPTGNALTVGHGLEGIEVVTNLWDVINDVDLFVFPDVLDGDLQEYLRSIGKRVWGSGKGEELEYYRWETKQWLKQIGLPVQPVKRIVGIHPLREYLQENEDKAIKISLTRGDGETWIHHDYALSESKLDDMENHFGARKHIQEFIVEDLIEAEREVGFDGYCIDGQFPKLTMFGAEEKDQCLIDQVLDYDDLPEEVKFINDAIAPTLKAMKFRGFISTEIRVDENGTPFVIDFTMRSPCPSGEIQQEIFSNWGEIMWHGANGDLIEPEAEAKFGSEAILSSDFADKHWMPIYFPDELARWVKLFHHCKIEGTDYVVPQDSELEEIGAVIGLGDNMDESNEACIAHAEEINGFRIKAHTECLEAAKEAMA